MKTRLCIAFSISLFITILPMALKAQWAQKGGIGSPKNMVVINNVLLVGSGGLVYRSSDFGENWEEVDGKFPDDGYVRDYFVSDGKNIFIMYYGDNYDAIFRSENLGDSWQKVLNTKNKTLNGVYAIEGKVFATGEDHKGYYSSVNGGKNWDYHKGIIIDGKNAEVAFNSIVQMNNKTFIAQKESGLIVSTDGMKSFKTISPPGGKNFQLFKAGRYLITGRYDFSRNKADYLLHVSADEGATWKQTPTKFECVLSVNKLYSALEHKGTLYITLHGAVFRSTDNGATWNNFSDNLLPFTIENKGRLCVQDDTLGLSGSVFFWTRDLK